MSVTIVLISKARPLLTLRTLWHFNRIKMPWPVIVADGAAALGLEKALAASNFRDIDVSYFAHEDSSIPEFYVKCRKALERVTTPYILMHACDDFLVPSSVARSCAFLDANTDYVTAGGSVGWFRLNATAPRWGIARGTTENWRVAYNKLALTSDDPLERLRVQLQRFSSTFYMVHRRDMYLHAYEGLIRSQVTDLPLHELFLSLYGCIAGKAIDDRKQIGYARQGEVSEAHSTVLSWPDRILTRAWQTDFHRLLQHLGEILKASGKVGGFDVMREGIGNFISTVCSGKAYYRDPSGTGTVEGELAFAGASPDELSAVRAGLAEILETVETSAFEEFAKRVAPNLL